MVGVRSLDSGPPNAGRQRLTTGVRAKAPPGAGSPECMGVTRTRRQAEQMAHSSGRVGTCERGQGNRAGDALPGWRLPWVALSQSARGREEAVCSVPAFRIRAPARLQTRRRKETVRRGPPLAGVFTESALSEWALARAPCPRSILCPSFCRCRWGRDGHLTLPVSIARSLGQKNRNGSHGREAGMTGSREPRPRARDGALRPSSGGRRPASFLYWWP